MIQKLFGVFLGLSGPFLAAAICKQETYLSSVGNREVFSLKFGDWTKTPKKSKESIIERVEIATQFRYVDIIYLKPGRNANISLRDRTHTTFKLKKNHSTTITILSQY